MKEKFWMYIMCSNSGTLYTGMTNAIERRVKQHKAGEMDGFSKKYECHRLVYFESFQDVRKAIGREKEIKGWSRSKKIALIESVNPRWQDLAESWGKEMVFPGEKA